jgi:hypothetical protein
VPTDRANVVGMFCQNQPIFFYTLIDPYNETVSTLCEFDRLMSNIGLLPNFVHVYFRAESATNLGISSYRCTAVVPWCVRGNNAHGSG